LTTRDGVARYPPHAKTGGCRRWVWPKINLQTPWPAAVSHPKREIDKQDEVFNAVLLFKHVRVVRMVDVKRNTPRWCNLTKSSTAA
jgi:CreA protein